MQDVTRVRDAVMCVHRIAGNGEGRATSSGGLLARYMKETWTLKSILRCDECSVAAVSDAGGVDAHGPEMVRGVCSQPGDTGCDVLITIASLDLVGRPGSIADGSSILKVRGGAKPVGIYCCVKLG